ncbi:MAG: hypothetical protein RL701_7760 [Pseudomonadota bacterium]|jgi:hypothetical protein
MQIARADSASDGGRLLRLSARHSASITRSTGRVSRQELLQRSAAPIAQHVRWHSTALRRLEVRLRTALHTNSILLHRFPIAKAQTTPRQVV